MGDAVGGLLDVATLGATGFGERKKKSQLNSMLGDYEKPERPAYLSILDQNNRVADPFSIRGVGQGAINQSQDVINRLMADATRVGPSEQATNILQQQAVQNGISRDSLQRSNASNLSRSIDQLASTGGIGAGNSERLAKSANQDFMQALQGQRKTEQLGTLGILGNDLNNKNTLLQGLPSSLRAQAGLEMDRAKFDIGNAIGDRSQQNSDLMQEYLQKLQEYGANREAKMQTINRPKGGIGGMVQGIAGK